MLDGRHSKLTCTNYIGVHHPNMHDIPRAFVTVKGVMCTTNSLQASKFSSQLKRSNVSLSIIELGLSQNASSSKSYKEEQFNK